MKLFQTHKKPVLFAACLTAFSLCTGQLTAQNLLVNGNFSAGNSGFQSSYTYTTVNTTEGQITVTANPNAWNAGNTYIPGMQTSPPWTDHTGNGDGLSLLVNGATSGSSDFWRETLSVQSNTSYKFSGWASEADIAASSSRGILQLYVNGAAVGSSFSLADGAPNWQNFSVTFNSGASTSITVALRDLNLGAGGNDFGVDDLSLVAVPEPSAFALLGIGLMGFALKRMKGHATGNPVA